jgi:hypothetical protein
MGIMKWLSPNQKHDWFLRNGTCMRANADVSPLYGGLSGCHLLVTACRYPLRETGFMEAGGKRSVKWKDI